jgi:hypothetical protein
MAHTPGPWKVSGDYGNADQHPNLTIESDFGQITRVLSENCDIDEQVIADAKLIAAAPRMLEALEQLQIALACFRDGQHYIHPTHGPIGFEELKYLVVDTAVSIAKTGEAH